MDSNGNNRNNRNNELTGLLGMLVSNRFLFFGMLSMLVISFNIVPIVYLAIFSNLFFLLYLHGRAVAIANRVVSASEPSESPQPPRLVGGIIVWQDLALVMVLLAGSSFDIASALGSAILIIPPSVALFVLYSRGVYNLLLPLIIAGVSSLVALYGSVMIHGYDDLIAGIMSYMSAEEISSELRIDSDSLYDLLLIVINMAVVFNGVTYMYLGGVLYRTLVVTGRLGTLLRLEGVSRVHPAVASSSAFTIHFTRNQSYALLSSCLALFFMATKFPVLPVPLLYALLAVPVSIFFYIGLDTMRVIVFTNRPYTLPKVFALTIASIMGFLIVIAIMSLFVGILSVWVKFDRWVAPPLGANTSGEGDHD